MTKAPKLELLPSGGVEVIASASFILSNNKHSIMLFIELCPTHESDTANIQNYSL